MATKTITSFGTNRQPKKIRFSGHLLWTPIIEIDLNGVPISQALRAKCPETLTMHHALGRKWKISEEQMISVVPDEPETLGVPTADEFRNAVNGE